MGTGSGVASVLLRAVVGSTMVAHGVRHGRSLEGTAGWFKSIGFREPQVQALLSSAVEIGSGAALLAGAGTPLAGSAVVGTMSVAARTVHIDNGYFVMNEGYEYVLAVAAATVALASIGAGPMSLDRALGVEDRLSGVRGALLTTGLGIVGAAIQLAIFWRKPAAEG